MQYIISFWCSLCLLKTNKHTTTQQQSSCLIIPPSWLFLCLFLWTVCSHYDHGSIFWILLCLVILKIILQIFHIKEMTRISNIYLKKRAKPYSVKMLELKIEPVLPVVDLGLSFAAALPDPTHHCLQIFLGMGLGPSHQKKLGSKHRWTSGDIFVFLWACC